MKEFPKAFKAENIEKKWYKFWEESQFFKADPESEKPPYCIVIPPPNVTGVLHMGHALGACLDDVLIRFKRMQGFETLWVPGTDHAGIATQTVVERHLIKTENKKRSDYKREDFIKLVWQWKEQNEGKILKQLKSLGCSCDWSRQRFTMDKGNNRAVRVIFKKLFDQGLIYRGDYLVNWDPVTQTAIADDEVEHEERSSYLWYFKYPFKDGGGHAIIATTRPETMLGDTALAVNPRDETYSSLVGKKVILPILEREIPIIADYFVDPEFGTGMVKITPAHDQNDYEIGMRHNLPLINIMTPDGKINENGAAFQGLSMMEARKAVVKEMESLGLLHKVEEHQHRIGISYRSKAIIEPYLSKQWFVKMSDFSNSLRNSVQEERVALIPPSWQNTYYYWIDNLRDWCISRQLWWGHRIPIWYNKENPEKTICFDGEGDPDIVKNEPDKWEQDADVLDTWFSSALWPFASLGWPDKTQLLKKFYPNSIMVTGHDILFFWVAKMIMMGEYVFQKPPFPEVYLHSLIFGKSYWRKSDDGNIEYLPEKEREQYDLGLKKIPKDVFCKWEKMSKSKGNIINPMEVIEKYGTDATRMALAATPSQKWEIDLDRRRFEEFKNFANKIWNGARFIFMNLDEEDPLTNEELASGLSIDLLALEDKWILSALNRTVQTVSANLEKYNFDQAAMGAYDFFWKEFCSYYLEIAKPTLFGKTGKPQNRKNKQKILVIVLLQAIRLMHPMAPFITEELFQRLKERFIGIKANSDIDPYTKEAIAALQTPACIVSPYPTVICEADIDNTINNAFCLLGKIVYTIRNIRGEMKIPLNLTTPVYIICKKGCPNLLTVMNNKNIITALLRTSEISIQIDEPDVGFSSAGVVENIKIKIPMPDDLKKQELMRLEKEICKLNLASEQMNKQLNDKNFVSKAPKELVESRKIQLKGALNQIEEIKKKVLLLSV